MVERRGRWRRSVVGVLAAALAFVVAACAARKPEPVPELSASLVIARNAAMLMSIPGVVGVYEGQSRGRTVLRVMVAARADSTLRRIPKTLEGYRVEVEVSGTIRPMGR
jgi:hypothetical protein